MINIQKYENRVKKLEEQVATEEKESAAKPFWTPYAGPQTMAFLSNADELFYGGAAFGGKSFLLLGLAGTSHVRSLILRRESTQLSELIDKSRELFDHYGKFNSVLHKWRLHSPDVILHHKGEKWITGKKRNRIIELAGIPHTQNKVRFKGRAHDLKAWDELPDFSEEVYLFVNGWNRTDQPQQRTRIVGAGNPPTTSDGFWVVRRWGAWLDPDNEYPAKAGELRWYINLEDGEEREVESGKVVRFKGVDYYPRSRTFIPALPTDNPLFATSSYRALLQSLPEPLRSQLLKGDFRIKSSDDAWQVIPSSFVDAAMDRWRKLSNTERKNIELQIPTMTAADIARGGRAKTVVAKRTGTYYHTLQSYQGEATDTGPKAAELIIRAIFPQYEIGLENTVWFSGAGGAFINIDALSAGTSVLDYLKGANFNVSGINFGAGTTATDRGGRLQMKNIRAWAYWKFKEDLDPDYGSNIALPPDSELKKELCAVKWHPTHQGKIQLEEKADVVSRTGLTLDKADAVVMANLPPLEYERLVIPGSMSMR